MLDENGVDIGSEQMAELIGDAGNTVWITSPFQESYIYIYILIFHFVG